MSDNKQPSEQPAAKGPENVMATSAPSTGGAGAADKKTEHTDKDTSSSSTTSQPPPATKLPSHFRGMPKQWEVNLGNDDKKAT